MYTVVLAHSAEKDLRKIPKSYQGKILMGIEALADEPFNGKKLEGGLSGFFSVRIWPYRIIYTVEKHIVTVTVVAIGHRKDVYKKMQ